MRQTAAVVIGLLLTTALLVWWLSSPVPAPIAAEPRPVDAQRAQPALSPGDARIEGRVVCTHDVADLAGTEIVFELHGQRATVETATDGRFVFTTSQDGTWTVSAIRAPGHAARPVDSSFQLSPGVVVAGVELRVDAIAPPLPSSMKLQDRESALSGRVVDREGQPITVFQVRVRAPAFNSSKTFNSPSGTYRFEGLPELTATVELTAPGFLGARREGLVLAAEERTGIDFTLERGLSLSGVVLDEKTLAPLEGAIVRANELIGGMRNGTAATDAQGGFLVEGLPRGQVELRVRRQGYRGREVIVDLGTQQSARITLAAAEGADQKRAMDYEGVGMQFESADAGQGYRVSRIHPEGGARVAGLELGDEILAADGVSAGSVPIEAFMRRIKGPEGTVVTLTVRRGGRTFDLHAARRRLHWAP